VPYLNKRTMSAICSNVKKEESGSESDSDSDDACIGFMFDTARKKGKECFKFHDSEGEEFAVDLNLIQGDPGHVQSGQYLWPAAQYAVTYIAEHMQHFNLHNSPSTDSDSSAVSIVELGAGCGLTALGVSQLLNRRLVSCVLTDRDYGSILLLEQNASQLRERVGQDMFPVHRAARMRQNASAGTGAVDGGATATSIPTVAAPATFPLFTTSEVNWGKPLPEELYKRCCIGSIFRWRGAGADTAVPLDTQGGQGGAGRDTDTEGLLAFQLLLIGSDLLYSVDVAAPLLITVAQLLTLHAQSIKDAGVDAGGDGAAGRGGDTAAGMFILTSSFDIGENINLEVSRQAERLQLEVQELNALDVASHTCRVQCFRLKVKV